MVRRKRVAELASWPRVLPWQRMQQGADKTIEISALRPASPYLFFIYRRRQRIIGLHCISCGMLRPPDLVAQRIDGRNWAINDREYVPPTCAVALCDHCVAHAIWPDALRRHIVSNTSQYAIITHEVILCLDVIDQPHVLVGYPTGALPELMRWWVVGEATLTGAAAQHTP